MELKSGFRRGRLIHQSLESNGLVDGEVGKHLAVDLDTGAGEPAAFKALVDQAGAAEA